MLTERREHAETIHAMLQEREIDSVVLKGAMRASERQAVEDKLPTAQVIAIEGNEPWSRPTTNLIRSTVPPN